MYEDGRLHVSPAILNGLRYQRSGAWKHPRPNEIDTAIIAAADACEAKAETMEGVLDHAFEVVAFGFCAGGFVPGGLVKGGGDAFGCAHVDANYFSWGSALSIHLVQVCAFLCREHGWIV